MARIEQVTITYETVLCDGLRENNAAGDIFDSGPDEPFRVKLVRRTKTKVTDGRGVNWQESGVKTEDIIDLTLDQAGDLAKSIVNDIVYAATVAEKRVLIPEPGTEKEED